MKVNCNYIPPVTNGKTRRVLKGNWEFELKCLPGESPLKYKARYCVRMDIQTEDVDYLETYALVFQWSTIRFALTMILSNNWYTKQVEYTNAFDQASLKEEVCIDPPCGFGGYDGI